MSKRTASSVGLDGDAHNANHENKRRQTEGSGDAHDRSRNKNEISQQNVAGIPLPTLIAVTPWVYSEIPSSLPPIPKILDRELEDTVFFHAGLSGDAKRPNYQRLEWLGDAYLELIASSLIFQTFESSVHGRCSQLRELLVRNISLAQYFRDYGLDAKARLPRDIQKDISHGRGKSKDKDIIKIQADMFEAYVAAAILSDPEHGLRNTIAWLKGLWGLQIKDRILENERLREKVQAQAGFDPLAGTPDYLITDNSNLNPKELLRAKIGAKGVNIRYEDIPETRKDRDNGMPLFTVGVYLDGWGERNKLLGTATAGSKKEAAQKAAAKALESKKLIKPFEAKKIAFKAAEKAAEEASKLTSAA